MLVFKLSTTFKVGEVGGEATRDAGGDNEPLYWLQFANHLRHLLQFNNLIFFVFSITIIQ